jgi:hypothetical protein
LADRSFRSVALLYVLYHLPDPALALAEAVPGVAIRRARRRGGPDGDDDRLDRELAELRKRILAGQSGDDRQRRGT